MSFIYEIAKKQPKNPAIQQLIKNTTTKIRWTSVRSQPIELMNVGTHRQNNQNTTREKDKYFQIPKLKRQIEKVLSMDKEGKAQKRMFQNQLLSNILNKNIQQKSNRINFKNKKGSFENKLFDEYFLEGEKMKVMTQFPKKRKIHNADNEDQDLFKLAKNIASIKRIQKKSHRFEQRFPQNYNPKFSLSRYSTSLREIDQDKKRYSAFQENKFDQIHRNTAKAQFYIKIVTDRGKTKNLWRGRSQNRNKKEETQKMKINPWFENEQQIEAIRNVSSFTSPEIDPLINYTEANF